MSGFGDNSYSYVEHQRMLRETYGMSSEDKARYFDGLMAGMMGFPADHLTGAALVGYATGSAGKAKSEELRKRKSEAGKRSAAARAEKDGTAQPPAQDQQNPEQCSNSVRESVRGNTEQCSNVGRKEGRKEERKEANASLLSTTAPSTSAREGEAISGQAVEAPAWPPSMDRSRIPSQTAFVSACAVRFPRWQARYPAALWASWKRNGWRDGLDHPIRSWQALAEAWYRSADWSEKFDPLPIGQALRAMGVDASVMRLAV